MSTSARDRGGASGPELKRHGVRLTHSASGTLTVLDDLFDTDDEAHAAFLVTVEDEGETALLDQATVIPFRR